LTGNWSSATLAVRATSCGAPAVGTSVTWTVAQGSGYLSADPNSSPATTLQATTDASGVATAVFRNPGPMNNPLQSNEPGSVRASAGSANVDFVVTTFNACMVASCSSGVFYPYVQLVEPSSRDMGSVRAGGTLSSAIQIQVNNATGWDNGKPVGNIGVYVVNRDDPSAPPAVTCVAPDGTALTGADGKASCDVRAGTTPGQQGLRIWVGEGLYWDARVTVTP
jgi:hypothetical protein